MAGPSQDWLSAGFPLVGANAPVALPPAMQAPAAPAPLPGMEAFTAGAAAAGITPPTARPPEEQFLMGAPPVTAPTLAPVPAASPPPANAANEASPPAAPSGPSRVPQEPLPNDVQFQEVGGGVRPAREVSLRGPTQNAHLMTSYEAPLEAADRIEARSQMQAQAEAAVFEEQARQALARQEAMEKVAVQRSDELRMLQSDFQETVQQLGRMKLDGQRAWANASTGDKIGTAISMFLGGLFGGKADNKVEAALNKRFDEDIEQQKFDYMRGLDIAKGQQTAFGMAMDRYRNEDAAWAVARAAAIDYTMARLNAKVAEGRGVDAANRADELRAKLQADRERTIAEGLKYVPPSAVAPRFKMVVRGQEIPGLVDQAKAQEATFKHGVEPAERTDDILTKGGVELTGKRMEIAAKRAERTDDGAKFIAGEVQKAGIPRLRALAENALSTLNASPSGTAENVVRETAGRVPLVGDAAANAILSDKANTRERAWTAFLNMNFHEMSGAAISKQEEVRLKRALGGSDPELRRQALTEVLGYLDDAEKAIKGGVSPEAQEKYDRQRDAARGARPAAPDGAKKGW